MRFRKRQKLPATKENRKSSGYNHLCSPTPSINIKLKPTQKSPQIKPLRNCICHKAFTFLREVFPFKWSHFLNPGIDDDQFIQIINFSKSLDFVRLEGRKCEAKG
jgi:hypothetical protein